MTACDSVEERVERHNERGRSLIEAGEPEKAALEFRNSLKLDQTNVPALYGMVSALEETGNFTGVVSHLKRIVEIEPKHASALVKLTQAYLLADDTDHARETAAAAFSVAPKDPDVLTARASVSLRLGNVEEALEAARTALVIAPGHPGAGMILIAERVSAGDVWDALELVERFLAANPDDLPLNLVRLQILETDELRSDDLRAQLKKLIALRPDEHLFPLMMVRFELKQGNPDAALAAMRELTAANPSVSDLAMKYVQLLGQVRGPEAARAELEARVAAAESAEAAFPYHEALAAMEIGAGDRAAAAQRYERLIEKHDLAEAKVTRARMYREEGKDDAARKLVDDVLEDDAKNVDALALLAGLQLDGDDYEAAILTLRTALNQAPDRPDLLRLSAVAHDRAGNPELAAESMAAAVTRSDYEPELVRAYLTQLLRLGRMDAAVSVLEDAVSRHPSRRSLLRSLAQLYLDRRDWAGADRTAARLKALGEQDDVLTAKQINAASLQGRGQLGSSIKILSELTRSPEGRALAMAALVDNYVRAGRLDEASAFLDQVLDENPKNATALLLRARLALSAGDAETAEVAFRAAVAADPQAPAPRIALTRFLYDKGRAEESQAALREGIDAVPSEASFNLRLAAAALLEQQRDYDAALEAYWTLYRERPGSMVVANNLGSLLSDHRAGDSESLKTAARVARRLASSDVPQFQDTYGWIQHLSGESEAALGNLMPAAEALPDNPWVQYHLGMTYAALKQQDKAREHLGRARALGGADFPRASEIVDTLEGLGG